MRDYSFQQGSFKLTDIKHIRTTSRNGKTEEEKYMRYENRLTLNFILHKAYIEQVTCKLLASLQEFCEGNNFVYVPFPAHRYDYQYISFLLPLEVIFNIILGL
jgi:hypothetical protein